MYKSLLDKVSRGRNLPPKRAAFFMAGTIPEKWRIYGIFRFCYHDFADSRCCAGRWPGRVGCCQSAGGVRLGQSGLQCARLIKKQREVFGSGYRKKPQNMTRTAALRFRNTQKRSRANKNRIQPTGTPRTRNVSPGRFLFENLSFSQVKSRRK